MRVLACACLLLITGCFLSGYEEHTLEADSGSPREWPVEASAPKTDMDGGRPPGRDATSLIAEAGGSGMDARVVLLPPIDAGRDARAIRWEEWWEAWRRRDAGVRDAGLMDAAVVDAGRADASTDTGDDGSTDDAGDPTLEDASTDDAAATDAAVVDAGALPCTGAFCPDQAQSCTTQNCDLECPLGGSGSRSPDSCWLDCADADICETTCHVYESCLTECQGTTCQANCSQQSACAMFCDQANCKGVCEPGATCVFFCSSSTCNLFKCKEGAQCTIHCLGSECGFVECAGKQKVCQDGTVVCNAECPSSGGGNGRP